MWDLKHIPHYFHQCFKWLFIITICTHYITINFNLISPWLLVHPHSIFLSMLDINLLWQCNCITFEPLSLCDNSVDSLSLQNTIEWQEVINEPLVWYSKELFPLIHTKSWWQLNIIWDQVFLIIYCNLLVFCHKCFAWWAGKTPLIRQPWYSLYIIERKSQPEGLL